ncbi:MAG: aminotransferase class IV [Candidatus Competibacteraceae bacterium]|nr:aminotransferase class IV [Candidatus Competibacteraceae bacterium]
MWTYLNDKLIPLEQARVSVMDRGFLYGDGLFETLAAYDGVLFRAAAHLERLAGGADYLGIPLPVDLDTLQQRLYACLNQNRRKDAILRLSLTRGPAQRGLSTRGPVQPTLVILCFPPKLYPRALVEAGAAATLSTVRRVPSQALSPLAKTGNYLNNILAYREAEARQVDEALMLNSDGELAEGSVSNLFLVRNGELHTPALDCGIMAGITRAAVLEVAQEQGLTCRELHLPLSALDDAQEIFYTNTTATVMPLTLIDQRHYGPPGPLTRRLRQGLRALIAREAGRCWPEAAP